MPTARESLCCREISAIDNKLQESSGGNPCCITEHEGFSNAAVCLDVWVLQTAGFQTQQEFGRHATSGPVHKLLHTMMYICKYIYAAINATCVRAHHITSTCPNACCIDCCIRHSNGTHAGPDLVSGMVVVVA